MNDDDDDEIKHSLVLARALDCSQPVGVCYISVCDEVAGVSAPTLKP